MSLGQVGSLLYQDELFLGTVEQNKAQELQRNEIRSLIQKFGQRGLFELSSTNGNSLGIVRGASNTTITLSVSFPGIIGYDGTNILSLESAKQLNIANPTTAYYIGLTYLSTTRETGTVTLSSTGVVTGLSTEFTKLFRNQVDKRVSKIQIENTVYTVQNIVNDTTLQLLGTSFTPITTASQFSVIGTFSPYVLSGNDQSPIYSYDSSQLVVSTSPFDELTTFQIAYIPTSTTTGSVDFTQLTLLRTFGAGSVGTNDLEDGSVTTPKIADLNVTAGKLATNSVITSKIADLNVTTPKVANGAITGPKIADGAITASKLSPDLFEANFTQGYSVIRWTNILSSTISGGTYVGGINDNWFTHTGGGTSAYRNITSEGQSMITFTITVSDSDFRQKLIDGTIILNASVRVVFSNSGVITNRNNSVGVITGMFYNDNRFFIYASGIYSLETGEPQESNYIFLQLETLIPNT